MADRKLNERQIALWVVEKIIEDLRTARTPDGKSLVSIKDVQAHLNREIAQLRDNSDARSAMTEMIRSSRPSEHRGITDT